MSTRLVAVALAALWTALANPVLAGDKVHAVGPDGLTIKGEVKDSSPKVKVTVPGGGEVDILAEPHSVKLEEGKNYVVTLNSDSIDSFLIVQDDGGKQIAFDDDSGGQLNSRLNLTVSKTGTYKVHAGSLGDRPGAFVLAIQPGGAGGGDPKKVYELKEGALRLEGKVNGEKAVTYRVPLKANKNYVIELVSPTLDTYLIVQNADGKSLAEDDDSAGALNSRLTFTPPEDGVYRIVATTFEMSGGAGDFTLSIREQ